MGLQCLYSKRSFSFLSHFIFVQVGNQTITNQFSVNCVPQASKIIKNILSQYLQRIFVVTGNELRGITRTIFFTTPLIILIPCVYYSLCNSQQSNVVHFTRKKTSQIHNIAWKIGTAPSCLYGIASRVKAAVCHESIPVPVLNSEYMYFLQYSVVIIPKWSISFPMGVWGKD